MSRRQSQCSRPTRSISGSALIAGTLLAIGGVIWAADSATSSDAKNRKSSTRSQYDYSATIKGQAKKQRVVRAGSLTWHCRSNKCTISGPWPVPGVSACHELAKQVGQITRYGHPGKHLDSGQLRQCNKGIATAKEVAPRETLGAKAAEPSGPANERSPTFLKDRSRKIAMEEASSRFGDLPGNPRVGEDFEIVGPPYHLRVEELVMTGTGEIPEFREFRPLVARTDTLTMTGTGEIPEFREFRPINVRTDTLTATGTRSLE